MEIRSYCDERAMPTIVKDSEGKNTRIIEGYAVVFEKESRVLFDKQKKRYFIEVIKRGAVTLEDFKKWDVKAVAEHDNSRLLARSFNGVGSLELSVDDYGVKYRFEAPNTFEGDNAVEMIRRKDIFGSSFKYSSDEKTDVRYYKSTDGMLMREVNKLQRMYDISIVVDPAYFGTDVCVRSLDVYFEPPVNEDWKIDLEELKSLIKN